jgi:hypothetical protein
MDDCTLRQLKIMRHFIAQYKSEVIGLPALYHRIKELIEVIEHDWKKEFYPVIEALYLVRAHLDFPQGEVATEEEKLQIVDTINKLESLVDSYGR